MARTKSDVNKSEEIRKALRASPTAKPKEIVSLLAEKGIKVSTGQVYFIKGTLKRRKNRKLNVAGDVAGPVVQSNGDPVKTILKVKGWAAEIGGLKKLKALVDALNE